MKTQSNKTNQIDLSEEVIGALADAFNKSFLTIKRWVANGDDRLTSLKAKEVFDRKGIDIEKLMAAA